MVFRPMESSVFNLMQITGASEEEPAIDNDIQVSYKSLSQQGQMRPKGTGSDRKRPLDANGEAAMLLSQRDRRVEIPRDHLRKTRLRMHLNQ